MKFTMCDILGCGRKRRSVCSVATVIIITVVLTLICYYILVFSSQSCGPDARKIVRWPDGKNLKAILVRVGVLPRSKATSSSNEQWFK